MKVFDLLDTMRFPIENVCVMCNPNGSLIYRLVYSGLYTDAVGSADFEESGKIGSRKVIGWKVSETIGTITIYVSRIN